MSGGEISQRIRDMRQHVVRLRDFAGQRPLQQQEFLAEALEKLDLALEELQAVEEDLAIARQVAEAERQRYQDLFEFAPDGYLVTDVAGIIREANYAAAQLLNMGQKLLVGKPLISFVWSAPPPLQGRRGPPAIGSKERRDFRSKLIQLHHVERLEWEIQLKPHSSPKGGTPEATTQPFYAALTAVAVRNWDGKLVALRWSMRDITLTKQTEERLRLLESVVVNANDAVLITEAEPIDHPGPRILYVNEAFIQMTGYDLQDVIGKSPHLLQGPKTDRAALDKVRASLKDQQPTMVELVNYRKDGSEFWVEKSTVPVVATSKGDVASSECTHFISIQRDITERKRMEEQLLHHAFHDTLTGLPNRALFMNRLEQAVEHAKRHQNYLFAVLFLDLNRFKVINDSLGHTLGDQLLIAVATRLQACLRPTDTAARLGGDEFTILLEDIKDVSDPIRVAKRVQAALSLPFDLAIPGEATSQEVFTSTSIGIALSSLTPGFPGFYDQPEDLLRDADIAMYRAKARSAGGKACYEIFDTGMHEQVLARWQLENDLRRAVERQELEVHYQPIVALKSGGITGFEALVRWQRPDSQTGCPRLIFPEEFISVAMETGLSILIDRWVLREACQQIQCWQEQLSQPTLTISVNLCSNQFKQPDLIQYINQTLEETGLAAHCLKLEITENVLMENTDSATSKLQQLQALGIQVCLDDFGTGHSSLSYLHHFAISTLKIDRSFISRMTNGRDHTLAQQSSTGLLPRGSFPEHQASPASASAPIVQTIIKLAQNLGMDVVAEGVETVEQLRQLRELQCPHAQGYYFSEPADAKAIKVLISEPHWQKNASVPDFA